MASITSPALSNAIRTDVPAINTILKALAKSDPSTLTDIENGTKRIVEVSGKWTFQELVDGSWVTRKSFNIDASSLDGKTVSADATASTIPVRDTSGKLAGDITGNAATASKATALASTLAVAGGGTGGTTAAAARTNLGVPPTSHASTATTYGVSSGTDYGHSMASSTTPKALGTAAVGSETAKFARGDHVHPITTATDSISGSVKLSDSTSSTSAASAGIAASPKAVKAAYDLANTANTTANSAATTASAAASAAAQAQSTADEAASAAAQAQSTAASVLAAQFSAGTRMLFNQSAAPTGWTKQTSVDDSALRVVSGTTGGGTGGSIAFSTMFADGKTVSLSGNVGATTLTVEQMPSHSHSGVIISRGGSGIIYDSSGAGIGSTASTGGSSSHTHSLSGTATIALNVKYTDVIICAKD